MAPSTPAAPAPDPGRRTGAASGDLPGTAQGAPGTAGYSGREFSLLPELSSGMKVLFYILSLLLPVLGVILYFIYRKKPNAADRSAARVFLILGILSIVFSCMCSTTFYVLESAMLGTTL
jgi:RsiW-degrading membrane proteinase PrsW (M82 family)